MTFIAHSDATERHLGPACALTLRLIVHGVSTGGESGCFLAGRVEQEGEGGANANFLELELFIFSKFVGE